MPKANANELPKLSAGELSDVVQNLSIGAHVDLPISMEQAFDLFAEISDDQLEMLGGAEYLDWAKMTKGKYTYLFTGVTEWKGTDKQSGQPKVIPAVKFSDRDGKEYICASKLLYDNCLPIQQIPCLIRVIYDGQKRAGNGNNYFDLKVQVGSSSLNPGK